MQSKNNQTNTRKTSVTFLAEFDKLLVFFVAQAYAQHVVIPVLSKVCQWTELFWFYNEHRCHP